MSCFLSKMINPPRPRFKIKTIFSATDISIIKKRWSWERLTFIIGNVITPFLRHRLWMQNYLSVRNNSNIWWRHQMETLSALLAICTGNSPVPGEFPSHRPMTRSFHVFFDLRLNKSLSKESWGWWFETLSRPLLCRCNDSEMFEIFVPSTPCTIAPRFALSSFVRYRIALDRIISNIHSFGNTQM